VRDEAPAITIVAKSSSGQIGPNIYSSNYVIPVSGAPHGAAIV
jgi:hypothetical protein